MPSWLINAILNLSLRKWQISRSSEMFFSYQSKYCALRKTILGFEMKKEGKSKNMQTSSYRGYLNFSAKIHLNIGVSL